MGNMSDELRLHLVDLFELLRAFCGYFLLDHTVRKGGALLYHELSDREQAFKAARTVRHDDIVINHFRLPLERFINGNVYPFRFLDDQRVGVRDGYDRVLSINFDAEPSKQLEQEFLTRDQPDRFPEIDNGKSVEIRRQKEYFRHFSCFDKGRDLLHRTDEGADRLGFVLEPHIFHVLTIMFGNCHMHHLSVPVAGEHSLSATAGIIPFDPPVRQSGRENVKVLPEP